MTLKIRDFQPEDQRIVQEMILNGLGERFGHIDRSLNPDLENIYQTYIRAGQRFIVVEHSGEIVGTAALKLESLGIGRIVRVNVKPDQRRLGIAQTLVNHLCQLAAEIGYQKVLVETNIDWYDAIRLYQRCGFKEHDRDDEEVHLSLTL
jgi:N-acetylglutamate synthase-like GNAT family acetyltransferase